MSCDNGFGSLGEYLKAVVAAEGGGVPDPRLGDPLPPPAPWTPEEYARFLPLGEKAEAAAGRVPHAGAGEEGR